MPCGSQKTLEMGWCKRGLKSQLIHVLSSDHVTCSPTLQPLIHFKKLHLKSTTNQFPFSENTIINQLFQNDKKKEEISGSFERELPFNLYLWGMLVFNPGRVRLKTFIGPQSTVCLFSSAKVPSSTAYGAEYRVYIACIASEQSCVANVALYTNRKLESLFALWLTWW